jgi:hypothetical protein
VKQTVPAGEVLIYTLLFVTRYRRRDILYALLWYGLVKCYSTYGTRTVTVMVWGGGAILGWEGRVETEVESAPK